MTDGAVSLHGLGEDISGGEVAPDHPEACRYGPQSDPGTGGYGQKEQRFYPVRVVYCLLNGKEGSHRVSGDDDALMPGQKKRQGSAYLGLPFCHGGGRKGISIGPMAVQ